MPIYEYKCSNCGHFEQKQSMKDAALTNCPTCDGPVQRLISKTIGVVFKGSGFYINDSRSNSNPAKDNPAS